MAVIFLVFPHALGAQMVDASGKRIDIFMIDEAPVLDGVLDDDAWAFATPITDLHQVDPEEFADPTEKTSFLVVYTPDALYVAAIFHDREPDKIGAQILRQGDWSWGEDSVTVMVDPMNQGRRGYLFDLMANSVRNQAVFENVTTANWNWRGIWRGETRFTDDGWIAEVEIPFKTLSFDPKNDVWGLNVTRFIGRKGELIGWTSKNRTTNPASFGEVGGMSGAQKGAGLDVVPSANLRQSKDYETGDKEDSFEPALDVFYKVTPSLTGSLTINTDFSGTGVDERQINLTRFGLFFPERRMFFLQDTDIFEFGGIGGQNEDDPTTISRAERESGRPFFSRRIGLSESGETIDIDYGGKLTGRAGGWDIGVLGIRQDEFESLDPSNLFVARLSKNVLGESGVGAVFTKGDPASNVDNSVAGVDFRYLNTRLSNGGVIEGAAWYQQSDTEGIEGDDSAYGVSIDMPNAEGFRAGIAYKQIEENFYPALGFVNRVDVSDLSGDTGYTWYPDGGTVRSVFSGVDFQRIETLDGELQTQAITFRTVELQNNNSDFIGLHYALYDENIDTPFEISEGIEIPVGEYSFDQYCVIIETGQHRKLYVETYYCGGEFFDGDITNPGIAMTWRPSRHFAMALGYDVSDVQLPQGEFTTRLSSLSANIAFTNTWSLENLVQYDNVSETIGLNSILRWMPLAGREVLLIVNRELLDYTQDNDFETVTGDVTFKFSYTFRF
ncbi:MAG: DUF5916 domain-containing protein [Proteobacteria bacterium]|nr:DUF5916 domain-containing protein [Pseudomonadota bacterium]